jgi:hypothetical protein
MPTESPRETWERMSLWDVIRPKGRKGVYPGRDSALGDVVGAMIQRAPAGSLANYMTDGEWPGRAPGRTREDVAYDIMDMVTPGTSVGGLLHRAGPTPVNTIKAYKLVKMKKSKPGKIFPLYVNATEEIPFDKWLDAEVGPSGTKKGKVKSKLGDLAERPGWHMGDSPMATHIGGGKEKVDGKFKPTKREADTVWAEVDVVADNTGWQEEANRRALRYKKDSKTSGAKKGDIRPETAHITDQIPEDGFYRYKTNPNMTGNWIIGGAIKVNRLLSDAESALLNKASGVADLPRDTPLDLAVFGFE